jgi:type II secretory ATPase GspE/PulE/Tfp pilus assembly ATPase PilB-like protein
LVKLLCQNCRIMCNGVAEREMRLFNLGAEWASRRLYVHRKEGCAECGGRGYIGRAALLEILPITPRMGDALAKGDLTPYELELEVRKETSLPSLRDNGLRMLAEGKTDLDALRRVLDLTYLD